ncbi:MAG TPA: cobalamin-dependent protein [Bacillota bacterium]|nr:cobalamin-dependent protein [Bacillota bacterium]
MARRKVLLAPMDPVHDVGLKLVQRALDAAGHSTLRLPPDLSAEEIVSRAIEYQPDTVLVGRTLGYNVPEVLARLVDLMEAAGMRSRVRLGVGGMAIRPELAAELGYDRGFGPGTSPEEALAFVEGREPQPPAAAQTLEKPDLTAGYGYLAKDREVATSLEAIATAAVAWGKARTSPGVERARLRRRLLAAEAGAGAGDGRVPESAEALRRAYVRECDPPIRAFYEGTGPVGKTRPLSPDEIAALAAAADPGGFERRRVRHLQTRPRVFVQYGTGCPVMDSAHNRVAEAWGADGLVHFDPSWAARTEGLIEGHHSHEEDGTLLTLANLRSIGRARLSGTLWQVRAHRGLNTPEIVVLAAAAGADLTKVNPVYGSLGAGTDPERLVVDGVECLSLAAAAGLPLDVVTNEELCGVPAGKAFAGMLIIAAMAVHLGGRPILQPLFCLSPDVMVTGRMDDNFVDYNMAKVMALRQLYDAPIWPGAPIGFLTHTEDRVQSATSTALHAAIAVSLEVDAITIASADEAYSGGSIAAASRVDTLLATAEAFRFLGSAKVAPTPRAREWADELVAQIKDTLRRILERPSLVDALYAGVLGSPADGVYPGRAGRGTVRLR